MGVSDPCNPSLYSPPRPPIRPLAAFPSLLPESPDDPTVNGRATGLGPAALKSGEIIAKEEAESQVSCAAQKTKSSATRGGKRKQAGTPTDKPAHCRTRAAATLEAQHGCNEGRWAATRAGGLQRGLLLCNGSSQSSAASRIRHGGLHGPKALTEGQRRSW